MEIDEASFRRFAEDVRYLRDRQDIMDLVNQSARGIDRHDIEIVTDAFHPDALDEHGRFVNLGPEFGNWVNARHDGFCHSHLHNITTHNCEIDGDEAHCESYVLFGLSLMGEKRLRLGGDRYLDRLERRNGVWKIAHRRTIIEWATESDNDVAESRDRGFPDGRQDRGDGSYERPLGLAVDNRDRHGAKQGASPTP